MVKMKFRMNDLESVFKDIEKTVEYNSDGKLNCAEDVFLTVYDLVESDFPRETVALISGFGGGIFQHRSLCGAVSGAVATSGIFYGRRDTFKGTIEEREERKKEMYKVIRRIPEEFERKFGSLICGELIGEFLENNRMEDLRRRDLCRSFIAFASKLCIKILLEENNQESSV